MNVILFRDNTIIKDRIFISKIKDINAISFINIFKEGLFEINMLPEKYNKIINTKYFMSESEKTFLNIDNSITGEKIELIPYGNRKIFYYNLLAGNVDIYEIKDIREEEKKNVLNKNASFEGLIELKNQTKILKFIIN